MSQFSSWFTTMAAPKLMELKGEPVTYTPYGEASVSLQAIIPRQPPGRATGFSRGLEHDLVISILRSALPAVQPERDQVSFPRHPGDEAETFTVMQVVSADHGLWKLRVK